MGNLLSGDVTRLTLSGRVKTPRHFLTPPPFSQPPAAPVFREVRHAR